MPAVRMVRAPVPEDDDEAEQRQATGDRGRRQTLPTQWYDGIVGLLRDRLGASGREAWEAALAPDRPPTLEREAELAARWRAAADEARALGFSSGDAYESSLLLDWTNQAQLWATSLGFREGMAPDQIKATALEALGTTAQNAALARTELLDRGPLLKRGYLMAGPSPDAR